MAMLIEKNNKKTFFKLLWLRLRKILIILILIDLGYVILLKWIMPPTTITEIMYKTTKPNGAIEVKKVFVKYENLGENIKKAAMAGEDLHFFKHWGFDFTSISKAIAFNQSTKWHNPVGSSTISQQTAKNVFLWQGGGYLRKIPETLNTMFIELIWGKNRILEVYLNVVEFPDGIFGVEAASQYFFNKPTKELTKSEAVMLVVCLPTPQKYRPDEIFLNSDLTMRYEKVMFFFDKMVLPE